MSSQLDFSRSYFALFGLPEQFAVDQAALSAAYRQLQSELHPDRFASAADDQRRLAVQGATHVNEAYATLKDEGRRARYLLALAGVEIDEEKDTTHDMEFLMDQMALREALEALPQAADPLKALDELEKDIKSRYRGLLDGFVAAWEQQAWADARERVLQIRFFERLREQLAHQAEVIDDSLMS